MNYEVLETFKRGSLTPSGEREQFPLYELDAETCAAILDSQLSRHRRDGFVIDVDGALEAFQKHAYVQMDLDWYVIPNHPLTPRQTYVAVVCRASDVKEDKRHRLNEKLLPALPTDWILGEFASHNVLPDDVSASIRIVATFLLESLATRPSLVVQTHGKRTVLERSKGRPRFTSVYLSDAGKRYVREEPSAPGSGGWRMPEYEVIPHTRTLRDGRVIKVRGHKRGDPAVPRKTPQLTRVHV